jgi:hypothetical protein
MHASSDVPNRPSTGSDRRGIVTNRHRSSLATGEAFLLQRHSCDLSTWRPGHHSVPTAELPGDGAPGRGDPVFVHTKEEDGWKLTGEEFENAATPRTKMIVLKSRKPDRVRSEREALAKWREGNTDSLRRDLRKGGLRHWKLSASRRWPGLLRSHNTSTGSASMMTGWLTSQIWAPNPSPRQLTHSKLQLRMLVRSPKRGTAALRGDKACRMRMSLIFAAVHARAILQNTA